MRVRYALTRIVIGGLLAGILTFGGLYAWNAGQGVVRGSTGQDQLATVHKPVEIDRD